MKKALTVYTKVTDKICYGLCFVSMIFIAIMMLVMFVDSMTGLFFDYRTTGTYEIVQCMLLVVVFTSWAYTQTKHGHIHVTMFVGMMPQKLRFICFSLTSIFSVATMIFAASGAFKGILEKIGNGEASGTLLIPYWPLFVFMFVAFALLALVLISDAIKSCLAIFNKEYADEIQSHWT